MTTEMMTDSELIKYRVDSVVSQAADALLRYGYYAIPAEFTHQPRIAIRPGDDYKVTTEAFKIDQSMKDRIIRKLLRDKGASLHECGDIILSINRLGLSDTIHIPKAFEELLSYFSGSGVKYRGQSNAAFNLLPSIYRDDNRRRESEFFYACTSRMATEFRSISSTFEILVKLQHYMVPTRLLDITDSPLVALYFAIENADDVGVVYKFQPLQAQIKRYDSLSASLICSLAKFSKQIARQKLEWEMRRHYNAFACEDPEKIANTLGSCYFVDPLKENPRIISQKGCFIVVGSDTTYEIHRDMFVRNQKSSALVEIEQKATKLLITKELKKCLQLKLGDLGISHFSIYPDLTSIGKEVKEMDMDYIQDSKLFQRRQQRLNRSK